MLVLGFHSHQKTYRKISVYVVLQINLVISITLIIKVVEMIVVEITFSLKMP